MKKTARLALVVVVLAKFLAPVPLHADPKQIDKLRKYYKEHNLDFVSELISDQSSFDTDEMRRAKVELLADDARTKALTQLESLLKTADSEMRAELLIRKATLLSDRSRTATYFQNNPVKTSRLKHPKFYLAESNRTFQQVERMYPDHPRMHIILFSLAYNFNELKDTNRAVEYYSKLIKRFPDSPLIGDARLAFAEILFDRRQFREALDQLQAIVKSDDPRLKNFALYKMAWTFYNVGDLESATLALEKVVDGVNALGAQRARLELRKEALNDLVTFYADRTDNSVKGGAAASAIGYFGKIGRTPDAIAKEYEATRAKRIADLKEKNQPIPDEETDEAVLTEPQGLLLRLVTLYRDQGKHEQAMILADKMVDELGRHPKVPPLMRLRAESAEKLHKRETVMAEMERIARVVDRDLPVIEMRRNGMPEAILPSLSEYFSTAATAPTLPALTTAKNADIPEELEHRDLYKRMLGRTAFETFRDFSGYFHAEWTKTKSPGAADLALKTYDLAVKTLLEPWRGAPVESCYQIRYRRAVLHYALGHWNEAASDYHWLALKLPETPEKKSATSETEEKGSRTIALLAEIASLEAWLKQEPVQPKSGASLQAVHKRLLAAYDNYLAFHLTDSAAIKTTAGILAASARLYKDYGLNNEALARMRYYTRKLPNEKDAIAFTRDQLALLSAESRWRELRDFSAELAHSGLYRNSTIEKDIASAHEFSSLKLLEQLESEKNWKDAVIEFQRFVSENPKSPFVSQALLKSANAAVELKDTKLSVELLEKATQAPDKAVRLNAWLSLEPYYRAGYLFKPLQHLYESALALGPDARTKAGIEKNLESLRNVDTAHFMDRQKNALITADPALDELLKKMADIEPQIAEFKKLRFAKTNRNPEKNFKRKTDEHGRLSHSVDTIVKNTSNEIKAAAAIWANITKAELLLELGETLETAAMPDALAKSTDADKQSYIQIIFGQVRDIREKAKEFAEEAAGAMLKVDSPFEMEARLNALLERFDIETRFVRVSFDQIWERRPQVVLKKIVILPPDLPERIKILAMDVILDSPKGDKILGRSLLALADEYIAQGQYGAAYSVASILIAPDRSFEDEVKAKAKRIQFEIDLKRLPPDVLTAIAKKTLTPKIRLELARWLIQYRKDGTTFGKDELDWFTAAARVLLRPVRQEKAPGQTS